MKESEIPEFCSTDDVSSSVDIMNSLIECQTTNTGSTDEVPCKVDIVTSFTECQKPEVVGSTESLPVDSQEEKRKKELNELKDLLPVVVKKLSEEGFDEALLSFSKQIVLEKFPLDNVAFLLWVDVVKWFDCSSTTTMRYSEDTKKVLENWLANIWESFSQLHEWL